MLSRIIKPNVLCCFKKFCFDFWLKCHVKGCQICWKLCEWKGGSCTMCQKMVFSFLHQPQLESPLGLPDSVEAEAAAVWKGIFCETLAKRTGHCASKPYLYRIVFTIVRVTAFYKCEEMLLTFWIENLKQCCTSNIRTWKWAVMATRWLSTFSGVARACAHAHMIFTAVSKRDAVS